MNRRETEAALKKSSKNGTFLFRASTKHYCTLSVIYDREIYHIGVRSTGCTLRLMTIGGELEFKSLKGVVKYLKTSPRQKISDSGKIIEFTEHLLNTV